ncbi:glycine/sarcosine/betaine reductase complex component C subunit alpha [Syntrophomonas erecta]
MSDYRQLTREVFLETAQVLKTGLTSLPIRIGLTTLGTEVEIKDLIKGAQIAMSRDPGLEVVIIGPDNGESELKNYPLQKEDEVHELLEKLLDNGDLNGVVTMHYPFPIGVSTVGKVITPARGKPMYIATTTGTSHVNRIQAMVKNAVYGVAVAKADGVQNPRVGILNVEGARQVERHLLAMQSRGYQFQWGESQRIDGGPILRGNDLIMGSVDVVVTDTLTGNILMKLFSSYTSGGDYEVVGSGYGPGVGENFERLICILSRASGTPVVTGAIEFCASVSRGRLNMVKNQEFKQAYQAGWQIEVQQRPANADQEVAAPPAKPTDTQISGIDILQMEDAVKVLWKHSIYAASGMGCTGPVIMVSAEDKQLAVAILEENQYL